MADTITLTVNVEDEQFKAFMGRFDELSKQMAELLDKFKGMSKAIDDTAKKTAGLKSHLKDVFQVSNQLLGSVNKITGHLGKWATLLSGTVMMLVSGRGLGIDRITQHVMNLRRQTMGITGSTAEVQGSNIAAQSFTTKKTNQQIIDRIEKGRRGVGSPEYNALIKIFQDPETRRRIFDRTAKDAFTTPQIHKMIVEKLAEIPDDQTAWIRGKTGTESINSVSAAISCLVPIQATLYLAVINSQHLAVEVIGLVSVVSLQPSVAVTNLRHLVPVITTRHSAADDLRR
jgi:hypothetical protein